MLTVGEELGLELEFNSHFLSLIHGGVYGTLEFPIVKTICSRDFILETS